MHGVRVLCIHNICIVQSRSQMSANADMQLLGNRPTRNNWLEANFGDQIPHKGEEDKLLFYFKLASEA